MENKPKIVIIDSNSKYSDQVKRVLEREYRLVIENSPNGTLSTIGEVKPDLILINTKLNRFSGFDICKVVKKEKDLSSIPVIFISSNNDQVSRVNSLKVGGSDFITLPIDREELELKVKLHLKSDIHDSSAGKGVDRTIYKKLQESKDRYRDLIESLNEGIWVIDCDGVTSFVNLKMAKMIDYSPNEIIGKSLSEFLIDDDEGESVKFSESEAKKGSTQEFCLRKRGGNKIYTIVKTNPLFDSEGRYKGAIVAIQDISDQKVMENRNTQLTKQLNQTHVLESIGSLASGIAHEFNNVLAAIQGYTELSLLEVKKGSSLHDHLDTIHTACLRAADLSRQILNYSRPDDAEFSIIDPIPAIKQTIKLLLKTVPSNYRIAYSGPPTIGKISINITEIFQIAINLGMNGFHAMENKTQGSITFKAEKVDCDGCPNCKDRPTNFKGKYFKLTVTDTGSGITEENIERMFDPFFTTKGKGHGTGLGLSLVKKIVEKHDGYIHVNSKLGKGSEFVICFKIIDEHFNELEKVEDRVVSKKIDRKLKVLLLDDEVMLTKLHKRFLVSLGYEVVDFTDSSEALQYFSENSKDIDLLVTDMAMPVITGEELAKRVLKIRADLPIMLITGYSDRFSEEDALKVGIKKYLIKPVSLAELDKHIKDIVI